MPKLLCSCGFSMNLSPIPNEYEYKLIPHIELDAMYEALDKAWSESETRENFGRRAAAFFSVGLRPRLALYECSACHRIALEADGRIIAWYVQEPHEEMIGGSLRAVVKQAISGTHPQADSDARPDQTVS